MANRDELEAFIEDQVRTDYLGVLNQSGREDLLVSWARAFGGTPLQHLAKGYQWHRDGEYGHQLPIVSRIQKALRECQSTGKGGSAELPKGCEHCAGGGYRTLWMRRRPGEPAQSWAAACDCSRGDALASSDNPVKPWREVVEIWERAHADGKVYEWHVESATHGPPTARWQLGEVGWAKLEQGNLKSRRLQQHERKVDPSRPVVGAVDRGALRQGWRETSRGGKA